MAKYIDLEGLNYNNQKLKDWVDGWVSNATNDFIDLNQASSIVNAGDNLLDGSRDYKCIQHYIIGPVTNGNSEATIGTYEETVNGYPVRYMRRSTFDFIDTYDTIKISLDSTKLKAGKTYTLWLQMWSQGVDVSFDLRVGKLTDTNDDFSTSLISEPILGSDLPSGQRKILSYTFTITSNGTGAESIYLVTRDGAFTWTNLEISPVMLSESNVNMPWNYSTTDIRNRIEEVYEISPGRGYPIQTTTATNVRLVPNQYTKHTGTPSSLTITFRVDAYDNSNHMLEYFLEFTTSSSGCSLTVPAGVKWLNGEIPSLIASTTYQLSIVNNCAVIAKFA